MTNLQIALLSPTHVPPLEIEVSILDLSIYLLIEPLGNSIVVKNATMDGKNRVPEIGRKSSSIQKLIKGKSFKPEDKANDDSNPGTRLKSGRLKHLAALPKSTSKSSLWKVERFSNLEWNAEDRTLSYQVVWAPTSETCTSLQHLGKTEKEQLGRLFLKQYGKKAWKVFNR
jgi:hypothetical protein